MKYLLDTHTFLWWVFASAELSPRANALIQEPSHQILVSAASAWEIATKYRLGRLPNATALMQDLSGWVARARFGVLAIELAHAERAGQFPQPHRDPFDRMIAAQSLVEQVAIIGCDRALESFGAELIW